MIAYPAIDLRRGRAVQLVGGRPDHERVSLDDPLAVAERWVSIGFRALHVVDLDAALGEGDNRAIIETLIRDTGVPVQVGGGIRDDAAADALIDAGAARVIAGTRAVEDPDWLFNMASRHPSRVIVAADVRDGHVLTRGWTVSSAMRIEAFLRTLDAAPIAGVLVTDVGREGRLTGSDATAFASFARACAHPLVAAGGIAALEDLRALDRAGAAGAVLGMALYTGAIDGAAVAREFHPDAADTE